MPLQTLFRPEMPRDAFAQPFASAADIDVVSGRKPLPPEPADGYSCGPGESQHKAVQAAVHLLRVMLRVPHRGIIAKDRGL